MPAADVDPPYGYVDFVGGTRLFRPRPFRQLVSARRNPPGRIVGQLLEFLQLDILRIGQQAVFRVQFASRIKLRAAGTLGEAREERGDILKALFGLLVSRLRGENFLVELRSV